MNNSRIGDMTLSEADIEVLQSFPSGQASQSGICEMIFLERQGLDSGQTAEQGKAFVREFRAIDVDILQVFEAREMRDARIRDRFGVPEVQFFEACDLPDMSQPFVCRLCFLQQQAFQARETAYPSENIITGEDVCVVEPLASRSIVNEAHLTDVPEELVS